MHEINIADMPVNLQDALRIVAAAIRRRLSR